MSEEEKQTVAVEMVEVVEEVDTKKRRGWRGLSARGDTSPDRARAKEARQDTSSRTLLILLTVLVPREDKID